MQKVIALTARCTTCGMEIEHVVHSDIEVGKKDCKVGGRCCADAVVCPNCQSIILLPYVKWEATEDELKYEAWHKEQFERLMANLIRKYGPQVLSKSKEKNK